MKRRSLRARVSELIWRLAHVETFADLAAIAAPVARLTARSRRGPQAHRALVCAHEQTRFRLTDRLWGGLLSTLRQAAEQVSRVFASLARVFAPRAS